MLVSAHSDRSACTQWTAVAVAAKMCRPPVEREPASGRAHCDGAASPASHRWPMAAERRPWGHRLQWPVRKRQRQTRAAARGCWPAVRLRWDAMAGGAVVVECRCRSGEFLHGETSVVGNFTIECRNAEPTVQVHLVLSGSFVSQL